jgi:DNA-3-methyladenine glycosylase I
MNKIRCWNTYNPLHIKYHDEEWGVPLHEDRKFFEFLVLGGFQAGLTWWLILERRELFRNAFDDFIPQKVAKYSLNDINRLMVAPGIIHNKIKIQAAINNASRFLEVQKDFGSFDKYIWTFVNGKTRHTSFARWEDLPTETEESKQMSKSLKKRGFQFVGPTICYAFMQATGLVNDHIISCYKHGELKSNCDRVC